MTKIRIPKTSEADSRTAMSKSELLDNSRQHISDVSQAFHWMVTILLRKAVEHDWTKITYIDEFYADFTSGFKGDEFKQAHWYKDIHLRERHHLKDYCPSDVTLFDILERIADGVMAGFGRSGSVYEDSLDADILNRAYRNTMRLLVDNTETIHEDSSKA